MQIEQMPMARVFFEKTGRAKYTSHLDVVRMLTRVLRRSGLPFWYTQGFNPHLYITFALPLALGYEGRRESMDLRLTREVPYDRVAEGINRVLPPGFRVLEAAPPVCSPKEIAWADYRIALASRELDARTLWQELERFHGQRAIEVVKKTKKGERIIDIKPLTRLLTGEVGENGLDLLLRCAAGIEINIAPTLFLEAFSAWLGEPPEGISIAREAVRRRDLEIFR